MMKVWMLYTGEREEYEVIGIFDSLEKAESVKLFLYNSGACKGWKSSIEERILNSARYSDSDAAPNSDNITDSEYKDESEHIIA